MNIMITEEGFSKLQKEYHKLKSEARDKCIEELKKAKEDNNCDISENIEYSNACEELNRVENKIKDIETKLENAKIINIKDLKDDGIVKFGKTVKLLRLNDNKELTFKIVGEDESNVKIGLISYKAPLIVNMMNLEVDDFVECNDIEYEIISVSVI